MPKPVCVGCQRFYRPEKNATLWAEMKPLGNDVPSGTEAPHLWEPYKVWNGDLWRCEGCGHRIIVGNGYKPISEDYLDDFSQWMDKTRFRVNDC